MGVPQPPNDYKSSLRAVLPAIAMAHSCGRPHAEPSEPDYDPERYRGIFVMHTDQLELQSDYSQIEWDEMLEMNGDTPSSVTSVDGSYGAIPGEEAIRYQSQFGGTLPIAPPGLEDVNLWHSITSTTEVPQGWEVPPGVVPNGGSDSMQKQPFCEEEHKASNFCDVPDCKAAQRCKPFSRPYDLKRHKMEQHSSNPPRYICGSCRNLQVVKFFFRKERVIKHLRSAHDMSGNSVACSIEGINQEVHFASESELEQHRVEVHETPENITPESSSERAIYTAQPLSPDKAQSSDTLSSLCAGVKRTIPSEPQPESKRGKHRNTTNYSPNETPVNLQENSGRVAIVSTPKDDTPDLVQSPYTDSMLSSPSDPRGYEEIPSVRIVDMLALLRLDGLRTAFKGLKFSHICFDFSKRIIKLQGPSSATKSARGGLEYSLKEARRLAPAGYRPNALSHGGSVTKHSARVKSKLSAGPRSGPISPKIFAVGTNQEDSDVLTTWMKYIGPLLPDILAPAVGENYSASLVRQGLSDGSSTPTIRIESASGQSEGIRRKIRAQIHAICEQHGRTNIPLHFSQGSVILLARTYPEYEEMEDGQANEQGSFPHHRRYWRHPGMGASIGLGSCKTVSATLGGYISVDKRTCMLTVDHIIDFATNIDTIAETGRQTITSPSLLDVEELTQDLGQVLRDIEAMIENSMEQVFPSGKVTLEELEELLNSSVLKDDHGRFEEFLRDLSRKPGDFHLGEIYRRCAPGLKEAASIYGFSSPGRGNMEVCHRMDWSIYTVARTRTGQNRHRHKFCAESGTVDYLSENLHPMGAGSPCLEACEVQPGMPVYYVGQSSGRQRGVISPGLVLVTSGGVSSWEWAMVVPEDEQQDGEIYCGDSGAWILRESDNALVGLLWGWVGGQLIFTPIKDVFADIRDTCNATEVCLPKPPTAPDPGVLLSGNATASQARHICRVKKQGPRKPMRYFPTRSRPALSALNTQPPGAKPISIRSPLASSEALGKKTSLVTLVVNTVNDRSPPPSPVPSLSSSASSSPKALSPRSPLLEQQPRPCRASGESTVVIREDSDTEGSPKADEEPQSYSRLQHLSKRMLGKSGQENRLSLGFILENGSVAMLSSPESAHERLKKSAGAWPSDDAWSRCQEITSC
ncbi:hypothetical protein FGG08_001297 [Glutinoglossum americanum]|uniref:C2H2-type domain-containing protein n=1 Tax=Glutinoglossum americanum TaxID=1670608 RepID=A0A9P8IBA6_9PEZI|nr:hypothetical protein FGG08_001297 [Glutinoglossum americanum]